MLANSTLEKDVALEEDTQINIMEKDSGLGQERQNVLQEDSGGLVSGDDDGTRDYI